MPTYEYRCSNPLCDKIFEKIRRIKDYNPEEECPYCGASSPQIPSRIFVLDDHPKWLTPGVVGQIQGDDNAAPIETRSEYEAHCKKHNIIVTDKRV